MEKLPIAVDQRPEQSRAEQRQPEQCQHVAVNAVAQRWRPAVARDEPETPGFHRQRLAAVPPLPDKITAAQHEQIQLQQGSRERGVEVSRENQKRQRAGKQHGDEQRCFVNET